MLAIAAWFSISFSGYCQTFDPSVFETNQASVDSFYALEAYPELEKALDQQVNYLIETARYDSLHDFIYKVGRTKNQLGKSEEGFELTEHLLRLVETKTTDSSDILFAINELSWVYYEAGLDSMCLVTDLRYKNFCDAYSQADLQERTDAHYNLGFDYQAAGDIPRAVYHFKEALEIIEEDSTDFLGKRIDCYNALGASYWKYGDMGKAKAALMKSGELALQMEDSVRSKIYASNAIGNLSLAYEDEGNLAKSMELLEEAIDMRKAALPFIKEAYDRDIQRKHLINNYHNLSGLYLTIGDLERALAMADYSYSLYSEFFPEDRSWEISHEEALGSVHSAAGNYAAAEKHLLKSLELTIAQYGEVNYYTLNRHQRLGEHYYSMKSYERALEHLNQTINLATQVSDEFNSQELAKAHRLRASVKSETGDARSALDDLRVSLGIYRKTFGKTGNPVGDIFLEQAKVYESAKMRDSAEFYLDMALTIFNTNRTKFRNQETEGYSGIVRSLPEAYMMKAKYLAGQDRASLDKALKKLESAIEYLREERRNFDSDGSQLSFIDEHAEVYGESASVAYRLYELTGEEKYRDALLRYAEERKTVLLKRQLNKFSSLRVAQVPDSIISTERFLLKKLSDPEAKEEYGELEEKYDDLLELIKKKYPNYYELRYDSKTASLKEIQDQLVDNDQTLIEFVETPRELLAFVITSERAEPVKLEKTDYQDKIKKLNKYVVDRELKQSSLLAKELYSDLIAPLQHQFSGTELYIIPDGSLYALNFEVLIDDKSNRFLIEDYTISYLLSATTSILYKGLPNEDERNSLLALAPGFENGENEGGAGQKFIRQPFAMKTAQAIGDLFSGQSLLAAQATEDRFKSEAAKHRIIHLGTHTEINTTSPMLSRLILTRTVNEDGYLHAYEIYNLPLRAELAVLTACETGVGKESRSEGVLSMAHGFAYAGCPSLVMSLWEIDEKTSAQIIESFYENLANGRNKNEALRQAKLDYLHQAKGELKNPYYWSGLVLFGETESINSSSHWWWISVIAISLLLIVILFLLRKKKSTL